MLTQKIFTIGFTKKTAKEFFELLEENGVQKVIDVRLNNKSQLAAFTKFPDIEFFLNRISGIEYDHDLNFAPDNDILNDYKKNFISWEEYVREFDLLMGERKIDEYILKNYFGAESICLLCSEPAPDNCHRRLVAEKISDVLKNVEIIHL